MGEGRLLVTLLMFTKFVFHLHRFSLRKATGSLEGWACRLASIFANYSVQSTFIHKS